MRQRAYLSAVALTLACARLRSPSASLGASSASASVRVMLRPGIGGIHAVFALRFRKPSTTGTVAGFRRVERIIVSGRLGNRR